MIRLLILPCFTNVGVTQLAALPSLVAGRHPAGVPRQLRNAYNNKSVSEQIALPTDQLPSVLLVGDSQRRKRRYV